MRKFLAANLCGDYEKEQLNPVYSNTDGDNPSYTEIVKNIGKLSAKTNLSSRTKVFEAIIDEVVEDALKGDVENPVDEESAPTSTGSDRTEVAREVAEDLADKAIAMHLVPFNFKSKIPGIIAKKLRKTDPMVALLAKAAHFVMEEETEVPAGSETPGETIATPDDTKAGANDGVNEEVKDALNGDVENPVDVESAPTSTGSMRARFIKQLYNRYMNGEISEDEFREQAGVQENENPAAEAPVADDVTPVVEPSDVEVPEDVPTAMRKSLRYLASSAVNHRNATVLVSRTWSGPMLYKMLDDLKLHLPANFRKKYNIK